jgi:hypothetical protein
MREDYRLFACARCQRLVAICTYCDRGQLYCGKACSQQTRRELSRESSERYQASPKGRRRHAARQARHRKKILEKQSAEEVTHRGTPTPVAEIRLRSSIAESPPTVRCKEAGEGVRAGADGVQCDFCGALCQPFARREPLRSRRRRRATDPRGSRAGRFPRAGSGRPARDATRRPR